MQNRPHHRLGHNLRSCSLSLKAIMENGVSSDYRCREEPPLIASRPSTAVGGRRSEPSDRQKEQDAIPPPLPWVQLSSVGKSDELAFVWSGIQAQLAAFDQAGQPGQREEREHAECDVVEAQDELTRRAVTPPAEPDQP